MGGRAPGVGVGSTEPVYPGPRIWAHFLPGRPKTQGLGHKNEPHLALNASGGPNYCFARSERARDTPTAASAVADHAYKDVHVEVCARVCLCVSL